MGFGPLVGLKHDNYPAPPSPGASHHNLNVAQLKLPQSHRVAASLPPPLNSPPKRILSDFTLLIFHYYIKSTTPKSMDEMPSTSPKSFVNQSVVPGDVVLDLTAMSDQTIKLGGGLRQDGDTILVTKAGKLRFAKTNKYWVEGSQKRYVPCVEDHVLGIVLDCRSENFLVDIKGPTLAVLPVLAFEGVVRRNIPRFKAGTLLYARVVKANAGMNPELSCMDASGKAAEFGPLKDGFMFETSIGLSRMLLTPPTCPILEGLGKKLSFEIAVGLNGRVWVNAESPSTVILVSNAIMNSETLSAAQQKIMVDKLLKRVQ